jgi:putative acetyltransferase
MIRIREEQPEDIPAIRELNRRAFGQPQEADLVDKLRRNCNNLLSLVALMEDQVVGHVIFSPASIERAGGAIEGMGLAPMAVLPEYQRRGIGSKLIGSGIAKLASRGCPFVIVLGHADYYPRFGFEPASRYNIRSQWEVPDDIFMILILNKSEIRNIPAGVAKYRPEFAEAM